VGGDALCSIAGALYKPRTPHGTKANTPVLEATTTRRPLTKVIWTSSQASSPARGGSADADQMAPCVLVTKSSPPSEGSQKKAYKMAPFLLVKKSSPPSWGLRRKKHHDILLCDL